MRSTSDCASSANGSTTCGRRSRDADAPQPGLLRSHRHRRGRGGRKDHLPDRGRRRDRRREPATSPGSRRSGARSSASRSRHRHRPLARRPARADHHQDRLPLTSQSGFCLPARARCANSRTGGQHETEAMAAEDGGDGVPILSADPARSDGDRGGLAGDLDSRASARPAARAAARDLAPVRDPFHWRRADSNSRTAERGWRRMSVAPGLARTRRQTGYQRSARRAA